MLLRNLEALFRCAGFFYWNVPQTVRFISRIPKDNIIFFKTTKSCWSRTTLHPLSHNCPSETKEELFSAGSIIAALATVDNSFESRTVCCLLLGV